MKENIFSEWYIDVWHRSAELESFIIIWSKYKHNCLTTYIFSRIVLIKMADSLSWHYFLNNVLYLVYLRFQSTLCAICGHRYILRKIEVVHLVLWIFLIFTNKLYIAFDISHIQSESLNTIRLYSLKILYRQFTSLCQ